MRAEIALREVKGLLGIGVFRPKDQVIDTLAYVVGFYSN